MILIEVFLLLAHAMIVHPWLRNENHYGERKFKTAHHKELKSVIKHRRVRALLINNRSYLAHLTFKILSLHRFLSRMHLICISADSINLTIMYYYSVRMSSLPAWVCVSAETRMYCRYRRLIIRAVKVIKECSELSHKEHTFIHYRSA